MLRCRSRREPQPLALSLAWMSLSLPGTRLRQERVLRSAAARASAQRIVRFFRQLLPKEPHDREAAS